MKRRIIEISKEEQTGILMELKKTQPAHVYKRLMALKMRIMDGISSKQGGAHVGLNESSVNAIIKRYREGGIEVLVTKRHDHGNRYMTREQEAEFLRSFVARAEGGQIIEVTEIHIAYQEEVGHPVTRNAIYYMLHKHGWRKVMPRGKHPKRASEAGVAEYQKISSKIQKEIHSRKRFRVMYQDEAGFGRINKPKRCWCQSGMRPSVPCHHIREYRYVYGAVSPIDGGLFTLIMPYTNTDCMNIFLRELSKQYPEEYIPLVVDNAAWHRPKGLAPFKLFCKAAPVQA